MTSNNTKNNLEEIVLQGYQKKLKTMKKKYFVLYSENATTSSRLEYYDSEKKFKSRSNPKRTIILKNCFNIFRRLDTKHKYVISLSMKDEAFCIVFDSEEELNKWLRSLLALQRGESTESDPPKPTFEHVWEVTVRPKGLAEERGILGNYYVCLTTKSLTLFPIGCDRVKADFLLTTIRRCGNSQCFFYMEVGRYSAFGAGELWMETSDPLIAQNMHTMIINAMKNSVKNRDENSGQMRKRSSSANETSKPISVAQIRQTTSSTKPLNSSPLSGSIGRERCDSLPSRNRTSSDSSNHSINTTSMPPPRTLPTNRPHSMYINRHSNSPPVNTLSPSTGCSESGDSSLSIDETDSLGHSLTPDESGNFVSRYYNSRSGEVIPEENCDDFWYMDNNKHSLGDRDSYNVLDKMNNHHGVLSLPITSNQNLMRKGSPASYVGSAETQSQYMDMYSPYSPCGSSPCDQAAGTYMPISPGIEFSRGLYIENSGGHSRASSLTEETVDGYVPMCPPSTVQDYVDMEQSLKQQNVNGSSSAASSCSITSGTPSTDVRFAEYSLDKVQSRFTPDDEEIQVGCEKPIRTYSVGSRLEHNKRKLRVDILNAEQNMSRARAFSVGSRAKVPRCDIYRGVCTPSYTTNAYNAETNLSYISSSGKGKKSSSAPMLIHKSQNSVDRMSDLMEIDFSRNSEHNDNSTVPTSSSSVRVKSFPIQIPNKVENLGQHIDIVNSSKVIDGIDRRNVLGYVEMKPVDSSEKNTSLSSVKSMVDTGYLEMKPVGLSKSPSLSSSPIKSFFSLSSQKSGSQKFLVSSNIISPKSKSSISNEYMNISPSSISNSLKSRVASSINDCYDNDCHNSRINSLSSSSEKLHMEVDSLPVMLDTQSDYMQMSSDDKSMLDEISSPIDSSEANEIKDSFSGRSVSSPIDIQSNDKNNSELCLSEANRRRSNSIDSNNALPIGSINFPLNPTSHFVHNSFAHRKCLIDATSGTLTIPDDDSHLSNDKKFDEQIKRGQSMTASNQVNSLETANIKDEQTLNTRKILQNVDSLSNDYADMSLNTIERSNSIKNKNTNDHGISDYVNYPLIDTEEVVSPTLKANLSKFTADKDSIGDYAVMKPVKPENKVTSQSSVTTILNKTKLPIALGSFGFDKTKALKNFKSIASNKNEISPDNGDKDETSKKSNSSKLTFSSFLNTNKMITISATNLDRSRNENRSGYELLQMRSDSSLQTTKKNVSRPNSVNSEKISPLKTNYRPNSVNSEYIPSISTSSSVSTLFGGGSSSSSSTLCGSKCQSPSTNSRPQSFNDSFTSRPDSSGSLTDQNIASRPPSVSSERELHYASLDLPPSSNLNSTTNTSCSQNQESLTTNYIVATVPGESLASPSSIASGNQEPTFTYAQIDFNKSECLKKAMNVTAAAATAAVAAGTVASLTNDQ